MLEFLKEYKEVFVSGLAVILTIVCMIIKRKPKTIDDFILCCEETLDKIPEFINTAESSSFKGVHKKRLVLEACIGYLEDLLHRDLTDSETTTALKCFEPMIEDILSTPQKKGVNKC